MPTRAGSETPVAQDLQNGQRTQTNRQRIVRDVQTKLYKLRQKAGKHKGVAPRLLARDEALRIQQIVNDQERSDGKHQRQQLHTLGASRKPVKRRRQQV